MFEKWRGRANEIRDESLARDLSSLQINTILKSHISGGAMPAVRFALCDISANYSNKLIELGADPASVIPDDGAFGGYRAVDELQKVAKTMIGDLDRENPDQLPDIYMLQRIRSNSNRLKLILDGEGAAASNEFSRAQIARKMKGELRDLELDREDYIVVRKLWELGTEQIAMQTVIELDGDVTTRIQPRFAEDDSVAVHDLHNASVNLSYQYWKTMISLVAEFMGTVFSSFMGKHKSG